MWISLQSEGICIYEVDAMRLQFLYSQGLFVCMSVYMWIPVQSEVIGIYDVLYSALQPQHANLEKIVAQRERLKIQHTNLRANG